MTADGLILGDDGTARCVWAGAAPDYRRYHDTEWGRPQGDRRILFEKLCLEGFQAGLSWIMILRKREAFRARFAGFEPERVARLGEADIEAMLLDPGIVRHRGKIVSAIANAARVQALEDAEGRSFQAFLWSFEPGPDDRPTSVTLDWIAANPVTPASTRLSKALKRHGFTFVGPTTIYALMQAMGMVNDHAEGCGCREVCEAERMAFARPR